MRYKPYEEIIHIYFIESLVKLGQNRCALNHYKYCTTKTYKELGISPSNKMKTLYKEIKASDEKSSSILNLNTLDNELKDYYDHNGALLCDNYCFKFLYNFERRINERDKKDVFIGIITINTTGYRQHPQEDIRDSMLILLDIIYNRLRKGDVINQWNENQLLLLLHHLEENNIEEVIERINKSFKDMIKDERIFLNIKFKKI